jgi:hypothetical protein
MDKLHHHDRAMGKLHEATDKLHRATDRTMDKLYRTNVVLLIDYQ